MARRRDKLPTVWSCSLHTQAKHTLLVEYLNAWFPIIGSTSRTARVLDGFAGPGIYEGGESGSPCLTIDALLKHRHFPRWSCQFTLLFNEQDRERWGVLTQTLDSVRAKYAPWPSNVLLPAPENHSFTDFAQGLVETDRKTSAPPTFAFIDPFGYDGVPIRLLADLLAHDKSDLFIYFGFDMINRFATSGKVDGALERLFGSAEYREAPPGGEQRKNFLKNLYARQLRHICQFPYVHSFEMVNRAGHTGNYMFFCTRDLQAFDRMKAIMWKLDPWGDFRFEDRLGGQQVLFGDPEATAPLQDYLLKKFAGQTVLIDDLVSHVIAETPFYSGQIRQATLAPMQRRNLLTTLGQRKRGYFPAGEVRIVFPDQEKLF